MSTLTETPAGRMAREWPELDARERNALLCENTGSRQASLILIRAEDAAGMAAAKCLPLRITARPSRSSHQAGLVWSPAYWAAIP